MMSSENYRYYCLDGVGHLHSAEWFVAENDEQAVALIEVKHPDSTCEVWYGKRLVAKISPKRLQA
jgi:hypothetical protein